MMSDENGTEASKKRPASSCSFWIEKKKRFCKTPPESGLTFCPSHVSKECNATESADHVVDFEKDTKDETPEDKTSLSENCEGPNNDKSNPNPDRCHFWLERKRRFCRTRVSGEKKFCIEHSPVDSTRKRIPCPNDPKHTVYEDKLLHHLNKCNAREDLLPEYHTSGINAGEGVCEESDKVGIRDVPVEEVFRIIDVVKKLEKDLKPDRVSVLSHEALTDDINKPTNGVEAKRHLIQQASLVANMQVLNFLKNDCHYIEFGAGKGGLSHWVQIANKENSNCQYLLIDKSSVRYKMDSYHKGAEQGPSFERLKIDIENLNLGKVPSLKSSPWNIKSIICMGKHLCGGATDLMLNCIVPKNCSVQNETLDKDAANNESTAETSAESKLNDAYDSVFRRVEGIVLALCCHHRCSWKSYLGKSWFKSHGLTAKDFHLIVSMSAWATCGSKHITGGNDEDSVNEDDVAAASYNHPRYGNLLPEEREKIGIMCKRVLDAGRIDFLCQNEFNAEVIIYTERGNTLENMAVIATRTNNKS